MPILGDTPQKRTERVRDAWQRVCEGRSTPEDGPIVVAHLAVLCGYFSTMDVETWLTNQRKIDGYETYCIAAAAKRSVFGAVVKLLPQGRLRDLELIADEFRKKE